MLTDGKPWTALTLSIVLLTAGCIGSQSDEDLEASSASADVSMTIETDGVQNVSHLGLVLEGLYAHEQNASPSTYQNIELATDHADLVHGGQAQSVQIGTGSLPAGTYDQVLFRLENASVESGGSSDHDHSGNQTGHHHGSNTGADAIHTGAFDLPVNVTFQAAPGAQVSLTFTLDLGESLRDDRFSPQFSSVEIAVGGQVVDEVTDPPIPDEAGGGSSGPDQAPAARVAVFAPNGDQIYKPAFDPEDGAFANSLSSGFQTDRQVRFSGTESEAVARGAQLTTYEWSFGDGDSATGSVASHAYDAPGVYEVTLTVLDTYGNEAAHTVRVVVVGWTETLSQTSFEDGSEWTNSSSTTEFNEWHLASPGHNSSTAWHVSIPGEETSVLGSGYAPTSEPVTLLSPEFSVPEGFTFTGYHLRINGSTTTGELDVDVIVDGEQRDLETISGEVEWLEIGGLRALEDVNGSTIQFNVTFAAPPEGGQAEGPGYAIDDFTLAGMHEDDMVNREMLPTGGHGHAGHDHSH